MVDIIHQMHYHRTRFIRVLCFVIFEVLGGKVSKFDASTWRGLLGLSSRPTSFESSVVQYRWMLRKRYVKKAYQAELTLSIPDPRVPHSSEALEKLRANLHIDHTT